MTLLPGESPSLRCGAVERCRPLEGVGKGEVVLILREYCS